MKKTCPEHRAFNELISADATFSNCFDAAVMRPLVGPPIRLIPVKRAVRMTAGCVSSICLRR